MTDPPQRGSGRVLAPAPLAPVEPLDAPPTFSIVIPAYQAAETIGQALHSALDQVHPAHEVIVIDDGSTDDLVGALRPFEGAIEVIRKQHAGISAARNAGAGAATGEFMAVLDADDRFHPRRIEALADLASLRPDLDLVTTDAEFVVEGRKVGSFLADNPFEVEDQRMAILRSCFVGGWPAVRVARLREIGGFDESLKVGVDWDCWLRLILDGSMAGLVDRPYYDYVLHPGATTSNRAKSLWGRVRLLERAMRNPDLRPEERPPLAAEIRRRRSEAVWEETRSALQQPGRRRRLWRLATLPGVSLRARAIAALAVPAPPLARRFVRSRRPPEERLSAP